MLRGEAFERALTAFCAGGEPERLRLLATYGAAGLRRMLTSVYETLRSAGRDARPRARRAAEPAERARRAWREAAAMPRRRPGCDREPAPERRGGARARRSRRRSQSVCSISARCAAAASARRHTRRLAAPSSAPRSRSSRRATAICCRSCSSAFAAAYDEAKRRESVVDFEDLQLAARDLLRSDPAVREEESLRFRIVMVDEFQDTNALQCELVDLLTAGPGAAEVFTVGDEFQSIYGFRHADVEVFRARRERGRRSRSCSAATTAPGPRCSPPSTISSSPRSGASTSR